MKELDLGKLEKDQDFNFLLDTWCPGALRSSEWKLGRAEGLQEWTLSVQPLLSKLSPPSPTTVFDEASSLLWLSE